MIKGNSAFKVLASISLLIFISFSFYQLTQNKGKTLEISSDEEINMMQSSIFGFDSNIFNLEEQTIKKNEFLSEILSDHGVSYPQIHELSNKATDVYDVRNLREGKECVIVKDSCENTECFIYIPNAYRYVKYNLGDSIYAEVVEREVEKKLEVGTGVITSTLWESMVDADMNPSLIAKMEDALAWSIDFYHTQKNDQYKLIYEKEFIDGEEVGIGKLMGAYYKTKYNDHYAVYYENEEYGGYYDLEGRPTKSGFLRAPVKFSRISSSFSLRRFHPVLKRNKPHYGTDYAAPTGTPIIAVANGVVTKAAYTRGNGKYIKIKHDKTYQTQYLHMSRFKPGVTVGTHVKQGDVIGYVGSTGLATGPHVCFRFWKNGKQINHLKENFPPAEPMPQEELDKFFKSRDLLVEELDRIPLAEHIEVSEVDHSCNQATDIP